MKIFMVNLTSPNSFFRSKNLWNWEMHIAFLFLPGTLFIPEDFAEFFFENWKLSLQFHFAILDVKYASLVDCKSIYMYVFTVFSD